MIATEQFPLAKAISSKLADELDAIRFGEPCELLDHTTEITTELIKWWFQDDYIETRQINFHEGQRQAILAIIYSHEVLGAGSLKELYEHLAPTSLLEGNLLSRLTDDQQHPKYAAKMATGTGKTWVLNALLVWQYLNKLAAPDDPRFTKNFLLVAPGLIVYDRLLDSFMGKEIDGKRSFETSDISRYRELFIPPGHRESVFGFVQSAIVTKGDIGRKVTGGGQIAITNWHLLAGVDGTTRILPMQKTRLMLRLLVWTSIRGGPLRASFPSHREQHLATVWMCSIAEPRLDCRCSP
ncbi:MAG: DEAD/DEAH box helicase family protein [Thermomicrobiales bacterium]|nr:DEAD/DEAH box helicase family protein [Thermomicrobiales bacterium]